MSDATFHPFPRLPLEIRQQIWEDACFKWRGGHHGLHYIKLNEKRQLAPLDCDWQTTGPRNRSAYLWHAGLWTACKESRDIAAKHWRKQGCPDVQEKTKGKDLGDALWVEPEICSFLQIIIHKKGNYEPWHQIVDMFGDIFCITAESWEPLVRNWKPIHIQAEDFWGRHLIDDMTNVAVEFDPSWNDEIEKFSSDNLIEDYPPSLVFLIRMLLDQAYDGYQRKVLLIDKNVLWHAEIAFGVYMDCDHDYLQVSHYAIRGHNPLSDFVSQLDYLIGDELTKIVYGEQDIYRYRDESDWEEDDHLSPADLLSFVVKRDNQRPRNRT
ncbi:hypothetical protein F53441_9596 [Fusarium austroafricanum]|uniref:2EXR domain-containing protein n=1 Tax=Fusarium austroafricanum TaxID=2364996 RepID=A0A8H4K8W3_9HYPO|nr:hypothetical protein F53441_9596 [Fusarium austroafricanum]